MADSFSGYHPVINFWYFAAVIVCAMFFMHPAALLISLVSGAAYSIYLNGRRAVKFCLLLLPMMLLVALINPLFNHAGKTILFYLNDNPVTAESVAYGAAAAVMFASVILWFSCYNAVMTSDKFLYLFGRVIPALSLVLSMALRFVPKFKAQLRVIANAQRCVGRDLHAGNVFRRARNGIKILSILVTWALENAIETSDSMRARGYGLPGRTSYSNYRFDRRDRGMLILLILLSAGVICGAALGETTAVYFPAVTLHAFSPVSALLYACYAALCLLPLILDLWEDVTWRRLQSRI